MLLFRKKGAKNSFLELVMRTKHYYDKKYTFSYPVPDWTGYWKFYTLPVKTLSTIYENETGKKPTSFFDCGCATGELLKQAEKMGMRVHGIDVKKYPSFFKKNHPHIEIISILDYQKPINYDIVYCNGTLTYLTEETLNIALDKFKTAQMVIAIHNTTEDDEKAGGTDYRSPSDEKPRLIKSQNWWVNRFNQAGFNAKYDPKTDCFIARPCEHMRAE